MSSEAIPSGGSAQDRALEQLAAEIGAVTLEEAQASVDAIRKAEKTIETARRWYERQIEGPQGLIDYHRHRIEAFARQMRAETGSKSIALDGATVRTIKRRERVEVTDRTAMNFFVESHYPALERPDLYLHKVYEKGLRDWVGWEPVGERDGGTGAAIDPDTGEVIPGLVRVVPAEGEVTVSIKMDGGE